MDEPGRDARLRLVLMWFTRAEAIIVVVVATATWLGWLAGSAAAPPNPSRSADTQSVPP